MLKVNESGFILLEMIICLALISVMVSICVPIIHQIKLEQMILTDRVEVHHQLYNKVQTIEVEDLPLKQTIEIDNLRINLDIYCENNLIVGQGAWTNAKKNVEEAHVYFKTKQ